MTGTRAFERLAHMPVIRGNRLDLLIDGDATFEAILGAIDAAERTVSAQYYTIVDDGIGAAFADALVRAAERGVTVRLIFDGVGSYGLPAAYRNRLTVADQVATDLALYLRDVSGAIRPSATGETPISSCAVLSWRSSSSSSPRTGTGRPARPSTTSSTGRRATSPRTWTR